MRLPNREVFFQARFVLLGLFLLMVLYYLLVFLPLSRQIRVMEEPLQEAWEQLSRTGAGADQTVDLNLARMNRYKEDWLKALRRAKEENGRVIERLKFESSIQERLAQPWVWIDFLNERQIRQDQLRQLAEKHKVTVSAVVLDSLADYSEALEEAGLPNLLWVQLALSHHLLAAAILNEVQGVEQLELLPVNVHQYVRSGEYFMDEIPLDIRLVGSMEALHRFLSVLPLNPSEAAELKAGEVLPGKPVFAFRRILLRKYSRENPDLLRLELEVAGFVPHPWLRRVENGNR